MNITATVEVNVWAVLSLPALVLTVTGLWLPCVFEFGDLNAHARGTTATCGLIHVLVRPVVGVSPKAITWVAVEGSIR